MPIQVEWTDKPVYTKDEGLGLINYPRWLYLFARDILADMDDAETALCYLPFMTGQEVRDRLQGHLYSDCPYHGSDLIQRMARKAWESHLLIEKALSEWDNPVVMCSFGKDSLVVLHMLLMHKPDIPVLWNDTRVEHPDTYQFQKKITKEWRLNLFVTYPEVSFWEIQSKYGWPIKGRGVGDTASEVCCKELKKKPTKKALKLHKWNLGFLGLNAYESFNRKRSAERYGDYFFAKTWGMQRCYPILWWETEDIWEYVMLNNIPVSDVYRPIPYINGEMAPIEEYRVYPEEDRVYSDELDVIRRFVPKYEARTGCWPCPIGLSFGKLGYYRRFYPQLYNILVMKRGLGLDLLNKNNDGELSLFPPTIAELKDTLAMRPCAFDYGS